MSLHGRARRVTIYLGEEDTWHHKPLYTEIVHRAHHAGLAGASVFRGVEGFGASGRVHTSRLLSLSEDLPIAVVLIDTVEAMDAFVASIEELVGGGLVVVEDVDILGGRPAQSPPGRDGG
jgi:PII-like signaling protein